MVNWDASTIIIRDGQLVGAFSVIVKSMDRFSSTEDCCRVINWCCARPAQSSTRCSSPRKMVWRYQNVLLWQSKQKFYLATLLFLFENKISPPVTVISAVKVNILLYPILLLQIGGRRDLQTGDSKYSTHCSRESARVLLQRQVRLANIFIKFKVILFVTLIKLNDQDKTSHAHPILQLRQ